MSISRLDLSTIYLYRVIQKKCQKKTVCMGIHFHKSLVFTGVLGWKLATNLSSWAPRSTTITPSHPKKLAPSTCFQALGGCLRPTTAHHLKDPHCVFQLVRTKISSMNTFILYYPAHFALHIRKHSYCVLSWSLRVSGRPKEAPQLERTLEALASLEGSGWLWWTQVLKRINLSLILSLKHLWKPNFCENLCPCKPFYFWHSFWMTLYIQNNISEVTQSN